MKKSIVLLLVLTLSITFFAGYGGGNSEQPSSPTAANAYITVDEARVILQAWVDGHPFQFSSSLGPESDDHIANGVEYYRFYLAIERFGVAEILVHKETSEIYHLISPGSTSLEPLDDYYNREHSLSNRADSTEWITVSSDWASIDIPATWTYEISDENSDWGIPGEIRIHSDDGSMQLFVGYMIAGDPELYLAENPSQPFVFDSGTVGYMLKSAEGIMWLNPDMFLGSGVGLYLDEDRSIFTINEDAIIRIARSYRSNQ